MATYIPQVQDKVTQVRPPQTDWQFESQLFSTRQAKYDQGHDKLSKMYGQILNSGLTREGNIQAREEFFKLIDSDLKKVAGIDLSLDSNTAQAKQVFSQIYENDYLVKDMVWTKNFQSEMGRADSFKNCTDVEKCGGRYWDDGVKYMQYKREEFKNSTNDESMRADDVRYIPYNNLMEQAMKDMKEAGLNVTVEPDPQGGKYKVKMKNGDLLVDPLFELFNGLYAKNPEFQDMYKVMAYNERKDWTYNAVQSGEYKTLDEAALGFVEKQASAIEKDFERISHGIKYDTDALEAKYKAYEEDYANGVLLESQAADFKKTGELLQGAKTLEGYMDTLNNAKKNMHSQSSMANIGDYLDSVRANTLFKDEITTAAVTFSNKDKEITREESKFALAEQQHSFDVAMEGLEHQNALAMEEWKMNNNHNNYSSKGKDGSSPTAAEKMMLATSAVEKAGEYEDIPLLFTDRMADVPQYKEISTENGLQANMTEDEIQKWINKLDVTAGTELKAQAQEILNTLKTERSTANINMNVKGLQAIRAGNPAGNITFNWGVMAPEDLDAIRINNPDVWVDIPEKAAVGYMFSGKKSAGAISPGRMYKGAKTDRTYVRHGDGTWYILNKGGDPMDASNYKSDEKTQKDAWAFWNAGKLKSTKY